MAARMQRAFAGVHCITATESVFRLCTDGVELDANHTALRIVCSRSHLIRSCETQVMACIQFYMMLWFTFGECLTFSFIISSMVMITCGATNRNITKKNCYQFAMQSILISKKREIFGVFFFFFHRITFIQFGRYYVSFNPFNQPNVKEKNLIWNDLCFNGFYILRSECVSMALLHNHISAFQ